MKKKKKIIIIVIILVVLLAGGISSYFLFFNKNNNEVSLEPEVKITNQIDEYGYKLKDRDTELYKENYEELKELLNSEDISLEEYAKLVSKLFIIDLYTIDNKISKYDIGGLDFVYEGARESFQSVATDTIYKTVENNLDNKRKQSLPVVSEITVDNIRETKYKMLDDSEVEAYEVNLSFQYDSNLGYDDSGTVTLIKNDNRLDVVAFNPE